MSPNWKMATCLVLSSLLHSTGSSTGFGRKNALPRGKARKGWEVGGQVRRPDRSLQTIWDVVELDSNYAWACGKAGTTVLQPKDEGSFHYLGLGWKFIGQGPPLSKEINNYF